jgi:tetratricopeptide (TPR) repeat protein
VDLAWVYLGTGEREKAVALLEKAARLDDTNAVLSFLGGAYAEVGRVADANRILLELDRRSTASSVSPFLLAQIYLSLHDTNRALDLLEKAYQAHDWGLIWLNVGLRFDPIRSDPRFLNLLHRMNFPQNRG